METEITIFEIPEKEISTNKNQRELDYENLQKNSKLDGFHFSNFFDMELFIEKLQKPNSNIASVLCKYCIQYCMPVIYEDVKDNSSRYNISVQNETPLYVYNSFNSTYKIIPSDQQFTMIGLKIPVMFVRKYNKHMLAHRDHLDSVVLSNSGQYGAVDLQTMRYTQQRDELRHIDNLIVNASSDNNVSGGAKGFNRFNTSSNSRSKNGNLASSIMGNITGNKKGSNKGNNMDTNTFTNNTIDDSNTTHIDVLFTNEADAMSKLRKIIDYIVFLEYYYDSNFLTLLTEFKVAPYTPEFTNLGNDTFSTVRDSAKDAIILAELNKIQKGNFGKSFNTDVMLTLEANDLTYAYNIGNIIGITDQSFLQIINNRKKVLDDNEEFTQQLNEGFVKKLEVAKKQTIAYNKYKTDDLDSLDRKQVEVVDLEYAKIEKFLHKDLSASAKNMQKLWYHLRKSFSDITSDRLKESLAAIRKEVPKQDLSSEKLLEGGVCPHVYAYGEEMFKNFGKPWSNTDLRDFMISRYALPSETAGYFCKICGEYIADADNEGIMKFIGGERVSMIPEDDPLQSMIWKEAMYITTTYVKFNTPIPLKPLVSSIAQGLRGVIGEEESKLYRSKTNTSDTIKDTLNLYAAVYIYAALCALMISNPNKMIFGKDKPGKSEDSRGFNKDGNNRGYNKGDNKNYKSKFNKQAEAAGESSCGMSPFVVGKKKSRRGKSNKLGGNDSLGYSPYIDAGDESDIDDVVVPPVTTFVDMGGNTSSNTSDKIVSTGGSTPNNTLSNTHNKKHHRRRRTPYIHGGETTKDIKLYERFVLTTALNLIVLTKDAIIKRVKNLNVDVIKQIFLKNAYTWAKVHAKPIKVADVSSTFAPRIQTVVSTDPFYMYLYYAKSLAYNSKGSAKDSHHKHKSPHIHDIKEMLGRDPTTLDEDIKKDIGIYDTATVPNEWEFGDKLFDDYTYQSFLSTLEYITNKVYTRDFSPRSMLVTEYYEKFSGIAELEKKFLYRIAVSKIRPMFQVEWLNDIRGKYNDFRPEKIDLAQHYCPSGERHKTGSYIYLDSKSNTEHELTKAVINNWLKENATAELDKYETYHLVNERCELCKNTIRDAKSTEKSDKSFSKMFKRIDDVLAFFQYYDTRCPKGDLHDIVENICKKCGMNTEFKKKLDNAYYEKYSEQFLKLQQEKQMISIESLRRAQEDLKHQDSNVIKKISDYKLSLQHVAEWSQISNVKYNMLINLGLSEGYKYIDIEKAQVNPSKLLDETPEMYKTQAIKIKNYITQIIRDYNMLINHENIIELPMGLREILDVQKKIGIDKIATSMPNITSEFLKHDETYRYTLDSKDYANYVLEYLAGMIVKIHRESHDKYKTMAKMLVDYFTRMIIDQEKLFSKAESVLSKLNLAITTVESDDSASEVSVDETNHGESEPETKEFSDDDALAKNETYENDIDDNAFDVENIGDIMELE
jgi:hypothetical protein